MRKAYVKSISICREHLLESQWFKDFFVQNGWELTEDLTSADFILLNTCAFDNLNEENCIRKIEEIKKNKKTDAMLVVCGCLPDINIERLREVFDGPIFGPKDIHRLDELVNSKKSITEVVFPNTLGCVEDFSNARQPVKPSMKNVRRMASLLIRREYLSLYYLLFDLLYGCMDYIKFGEYVIKIEEGCLGDCSYCVIKRARGNLRSRPAADIRKELESGVEKGFKRIGLFGNDLGAYGLDAGSNLCTLLEQLREVEGDFELMLYDLNPRWFNLYFTRLREIIRLRKVAAIHLPVQSGSDAVLERMKRGYKASELKKNILDLRKDVPDVSLTATFMVGFPGETDEEFKETLDFVSEVNFNDFVLPITYSSRPGTPASEMPEQLPEHVKKERQNTLSKKLVLQLFKNKL